MTEREVKIYDGHPGRPKGVKIIGGSGASQNVGPTIIPDRSTTVEIKEVKPDAPEETGNGEAKGSSGSEGEGQITGEVEAGQENDSNRV